MLCRGIERVQYKYGTFTTTRNVAIASLYPSRLDSFSRFPLLAIPTSTYI